MADHLESPTRLEAWYLALDARYVDLVGDYAGKERFFIEGDSLLLQIFSTPQLDFEGTWLKCLLPNNDLGLNSALVLALSVRFGLTGAGHELF